MTSWPVTATRRRRTPLRDRADGQPRPMSARVSARVRILGASVVLLSLALLASIAATRFVMAQRMSAQVRQELLNERDEFRSVLAGATADGPASSGSGEEAIGSAHPAPTVARVLATASSRSVPERDIAFLGLLDGRVTTRSAAPAPTDLALDTPLVRMWSGAVGTTQGTSPSPAGTVHYLAEPFTVPGDPNRGVFVVVSFSRADTAALNRLTALQAEIGLAALLAGSGLAWLLAGRVLRPVRQTTELARRITERNLAERIPVDSDDEVGDMARTFNGMLDRLEAGLTHQRQLLADVSHELRTPITVVQGNLETLDPASDEDRTSLLVAQEELDRMTRMVEDLLVLARRDQPDFVVRSPVTVAALAHSLGARVTALSARPWRLDVSGDAHSVTVDTARIQQAVMELALNAQRHAPGTEPLELAVRVVGLDLHLTVSDRGPGIPADRRERVFERFARLEHPRTTGSGLGLAIVAAIAEAHQGHARVRDRDDGQPGACFELVLPVVRPEPARHPHPVRSRPEDVRAR